MSNNNTYQNLTTYIIGVADIDGNAVQNITDWQLFNGTNFSSIAILNMPFETNTGTATSNVKDYTTYNNSGNLGNQSASAAPAWNFTSTFGGNYVFDGVNDFIAIPSRDLFNSHNTDAMTFSFWMQSDSYSATQVVMSRRHPCDNDAHFNIFVSGNALHFYGYSDISVGAIALSSGAVLTNGQPYHVVWSKKWGQTGTKLFVNGVDTAFSGDDSTQGTTYADLRTFIGAQESAGSCLGPLTNFFNGSIGDILVFNRSLSTEQAIQLYIETNMSRHSMTLSNNETNAREIWRNCVTPNDARIDGNTVCSNNVTITNTIPIIISAILNSTNPSTNDTNQNLTLYLNVSDPDRQNVNNITDWRLRNNSISLLHVPFETNTASTATGAIRDYSTNANNGTPVSYTHLTLPTM
jgi:hypothetical protein